MLELKGIVNLKNQKRSLDTQFSMGRKLREVFATANVDHIISQSLKPKNIGEQRIRGLFPGSRIRHIQGSFLVAREVGPGHMSGLCFRIFIGQ